MRLCFIGGGIPLTGELDNVMNYFSHQVGAEDKVLIIPFATEDSKLDRWFAFAKIL
ncbi:hypothetical protein GMD78_05450 [Ornithinibacillus sp. L9]|uniref:Uncharacterized protein n=1 Tax=Ornithinibacillus caprae TaxID=2678566 RepID=A0A6N8FHW6_9BACI|nr:hypothetical protein [Ornithinibacillus caprae]MUK87844.1 hypothetical protein [Ornithinibacillus caprae]